MEEAPENLDRLPVGSLVCPDPEERADLWPWSAKREEDGVLALGSHRMTELAEEFGTPLYVLDRADVRGRAQVWATAMAEEFWDGYGMNGGHACYAAKAFMCADMVRTVTEQGMGVDTASYGELAVTLRSGVNPAEIGLHGNNKTNEEIRLALGGEGNDPVGRLYVDSLEEVERINKIAGELGVVAPVMIRVKTGIHAGGNSYIATSHEDQKFGIDVGDGFLDKVVDTIEAAPNLELIGLHSHIGSQILMLDAFVQAVRVTCILHAQVSERIGRQLTHMNLGGGLGVAYTNADPVAPSIISLVRALANEVRRKCKELDIPVPTVLVEPGRSIVAPAMISLYRVGSRKQALIGDGKTRLYVSVDGGMSDNIRPCLYGAQYMATLANRVSDAPLVRSRVVGKHCESGDIIVWDVDLPSDITAGDLIAVPVTGAYGYSMASNYNMMAKPGVVAVDGDEAEWIIHRQGLEHLLALDAKLAAN